jgi:hypothetical protein
MATPLAGVAELTVRTYVAGTTGAVGAEVVPPAPQELMERARKVAMDAATACVATMNEEPMGG